MRRKDNKRKVPKPELAHVTWTKAEIQWLATAERLNIEILNLEKTFSTIASDPPKKVLQIETEIEPCVVKTASPDILILASVSFSDDEENFVGEFAAEDCIGYVRLNGQRIPDDPTWQKHISYQHRSGRGLLPHGNMPRLDFVIFEKFNVVRDEIWDMARNAKTDGRIPIMRFLMCEPIYLDWQEFKSDKDWLSRKHPARDFVFLEQYCV